MAISRNMIETTRKKMIPKELIKIPGQEESERDYRGESFIL